MMLHAAALAFPTGQGTQAAIFAMLAALQRAGRAPRLLCYASGDPTPTPTWTVHRIGNFPRQRTHRSGPTPEKLALDLRLGLRLRALRRALRPQVVIAHHVEAAVVAGADAVFFAHTDLAAELPTYGPSAAAAFLRRAGSLLDDRLVERARAVAAISPRLAATLGKRSGRRIVYVPTPWQPIAHSVSRDRARADLGVARDTPLLVYAGNLDAYQGWPVLVATLVRLRDTQLLVATESEPGPLVAEARRAGVADRILLAPLRDERDRARAHAAADAAVVPRHAPGGLPIKLLDALARGTPVAAMPDATAGLPLGRAVRTAPDATPHALAATVGALISHERSRQEMITTGRAYLHRHHTDRHFLDALDSVLDVARGHTS